VADIQTDLQKDSGQQTERQVLQHDRLERQVRKEIRHYFTVSRTFEEE
jgi:hypothetical protein